MSERAFLRSFGRPMDRDALSVAAPHFGFSELPYSLFQHRSRGRRYKKLGVTCGAQAAAAAAAAAEAAAAAHYDCDREAPPPLPRPPPSLPPRSGGGHGRAQVEKVVRRLYLPARSLALTAVRALLRLIISSLA